MCACICACMWLYVFVCACTCTHWYLCAHTHLGETGCVFASVYTCIYMCMFVHAHLGVAKGCAWKRQRQKGDVIYLDYVILFNRWP